MNKDLDHNSCEDTEERFSQDEKEAHQVRARFSYNTLSFYDLSLKFVLIDLMMFPARSTFRAVGPS